ncbi:MAG: hypothetical protein K2X02_05420 [Alphaproteobacteria bacterium]|nr:hypothetical protein [Alphaproteobacteria bacterium]
MADRQNDLREQLDLDGARVAFRAIANGYSVNWGEFDFKNPEDDQRATKVHNYLDAVLRNKYMEWAEKSAGIRRTNTDYLQDPNYLRFDMRYKKYFSMQNTLNDS